MSRPTDGGKPAKGVEGITEEKAPGSAADFRPKGYKVKSRKAAGSHEESPKRKVPAPGKDFAVDEPEGDVDESPAPHRPSGRLVLSPSLGGRRLPEEPRPSRKPVIAAVLLTVAGIVGIVHPLYFAYLLPGGLPFSPEFGDVNGTFVGPDDAPIGMARVTGHVTGPEGRAIRAFSSSSGEFLIQNISRGEQTLQVERYGFRSLDLRVYVVADQRNTLGVLKLKAVAAVPDDDRTSGPANLSGVVRNSAGVAIAGASVHLAGGTGPNQTTAANGSFRVTGLSAGTSTFEVRDPGYAPTNFRRLLHTGENSLDAVLQIGPADRTVTVDGAVGNVTLRGRVTGPAGEAVAGAVVWIPDSGLAPLSTNASGGFEAKAVHPGVQTIAVVAGGSNRTVRTGLNAGTEEIVLTLHAGTPAFRNTAVDTQRTLLTCGGIIWMFSFLTLIAAYTSYRRTSLRFTLLAPVVSTLLLYSLSPPIAILGIVALALIYLSRGEFE